MLFQVFVYENQRMNDNNSYKNKEEHDGRYQDCE